MRTTSVSSLALGALVTTLSSCGPSLVRPQAQPQLPPMLVAHSAIRDALSPEQQLGRDLFFDPRLSRDGTVSCSTCHDPKKGFSNGKPVGIGIGGQRGKRNVPTVLSAARSTHQFWDGRAKTLEEQALGPIQAPDEMAMPLPELTRRLQTIPSYVVQFRRVYGGTANPERVGKAIAAYERTIVAPEDLLARLSRGDERALASLTTRQRSGYFLFRTRGCTGCHDHTDLRDNSFHNVGIGTDKPSPDVGRYAVTKDPKDWAAFKTPTLRNVADTAPYMHDGSMATLRDVVEYYSKGGQPNQNLDPKIQPLHLESWQVDDLVGFLSVLKGQPLP